MLKTNQIETNNIVRKNYSYIKNNIGLNFNLRTYVKHELKDFLELLKVAQKEVEIDIEKLCH